MMHIEWKHEGFPPLSNYVKCYLKTYEPGLKNNEVESVYEHIVPHLSGVDRGSFTEAFIKMLNLDLSNFSQWNASLFFGSDIKSITTPDKLEVIGSDCFACCIYLEQIILNSSLKMIYPKAFMDTALKEIKVPEGCNFYSNSFSGAYYLDKLYLPKSLEGIAIIESERRYNGDLTIVYY